MKYDVREKTDLLKEAGLALEELENKISTMAIEREEERLKLESKLYQMEEDLSDSRILFPNESAASGRSHHHHPDEDESFGFKHLTSPDPRDEDEKLLREVDAEIARGVPAAGGVGAAGGVAGGVGHLSPTKTSLMLPLNDLAAIPLNNLRPNYLAVVEEKDAEAEVEELSKALKDTEKTLEEVREMLSVNIRQKLFFTRVHEKKRKTRRR